MMLVRGPALAHEPVDTDNRQPHQRDGSNVTTVGGRQGHGNPLPVTPLAPWTSASPPPGSLFLLQVRGVLVAGR